MTAVSQLGDTDERPTWVQLTAGASIADVSRTTLHRAMHRGELPFATIGGRRFIAEHDLVAWREQRRGDVQGA
jgi:Helix-turn-helix domain